MEKYGIDNHFQYHLINYNEPTAYAALTLCRSTIMEMIMSYTLPSLPYAYDALERTDKGDDGDLHHYQTPSNLMSNNANAAGKPA